MDKNETSKIPISIKQKLRQDLLKNYDKIPHPVDDPGNIHKPRGQLRGREVSQMTIL